jgi:hypothetical protein
MISFRQLCYKDLGFKNKLKGKVEVKTAIMSTMVFEQECISPLLESKVPITLFLERSKDESGP